MHLSVTCCTPGAVDALATGPDACGTPPLAEMDTALPLAELDAALLHSLCASVSGSDTSSGERGGSICESDAGGDASYHINEFALDEWQRAPAPGAAGCVHVADGQLCVHMYV